MLNERLSAARRIASELFPLEQELDATFLRVNRLTSAIIEGRAAARMPIATGQQSLSELTAATALLAEVRARIAAAHAALAEDRLNAGLRQFAMGDVDECPPPPSGLIRAVDQDNQRVA